MIDIRVALVLIFPKRIMLLFPVEPGAHHTTNFVFSRAFTGVFLSETYFGKPLIYGG